MFLFEGLRTLRILFLNCYPFEFQKDLECVFLSWHLTLNLKHLLKELVEGLVC